MKNINWNDEELKRNQKMVDEECQLWRDELMTDPFKEEGDGGNIQIECGTTGCSPTKEPLTVSAEIAHAGDIPSLRQGASDGQILVSNAEGEMNWADSIPPHDHSRYMVSNAELEGLLVVQHTHSHSHGGYGGAYGGAYNHSHGHLNHTACAAIATLDPHAVVKVIAGLKDEIATLQANMQVMKEQLGWQKVNDPAIMITDGAVKRLIEEPVPLGRSTRRSGPESDEALNEAYERARVRILGE